MQVQQSQEQWLHPLHVRARKRFQRDDLITDRRECLEDTFYLVLEGCARIALVANDGRERVIGYQRAGSMFGEQAGLSHSQLQAEIVIRAETGCVIGYVSTKDIIDAVRVNPELITDLMRIAAEKTSGFLQEIERLAFGNARMQIAMILLSLSGPRDCLNITQERLAYLTGLTRMTVGAQLHELARIGAIRLGRSKIEVLNPDLLATLSHAHDDLSDERDNSLKRRSPHS